MKKFLGKIIGIDLVFILGYQKFSYADVYVPDPIEENAPIAFLIGLILVTVVVISAITLLSLKITTRNLEKESKENLIEKNNKKMNIIQLVIYISTIVIAIIGHIYSDHEFYFSEIWFYIPIIGIIISIIIRGIFRKRKISNIICGISVVLICIIPLHCKSVEDYNGKLFKYNKYKYNTVEDVDGLIKEVVENNIKLNKVTIIYQGKSYTSMNELTQLITQIDKNKNYRMVNIDTKFNYIKSITLAPYIDEDIMHSIYDMEIMQKKKGYVSETEVDKFIVDIYRNQKRGKDNEINIMYEGRIIKTNNENVEEIENLMDEMSSEKYKVEFDNIENLTITEVKSK